MQENLSMDNERAIEIVRLLSSGIDPCTGEVLTKEHVLHQAEVIRALFYALHALEKYSSRPANSGNSWTESEDQRLLAAFHAGITEEAIARAHQRSVGAIVSRLTKLNEESTSHQDDDMSSFMDGDEFCDDTGYIEDTSLHDIYDAISDGSGEPVYLSDGVWLDSGGRTHDWGR